ncbi:MAG: hypothetical protein ACREBO_05905 [Novosphingobium sp.]
MRKFAIAFAAGAALLAGPALQAKPRLTADQRLDKLLEGRVAGEPRSCISDIASDNMQIIDGKALVYGRGKTIWVNVPRNADSLDDDDILVIRKLGGQLCRLDMITTHDRTSGFYTGFLALGDFVPYRKAG